MKAVAILALSLLAVTAIAQQKPTLRIRTFTPEVTSTIPAEDLATVRDILQKFRTTQTSTDACPTDMLGEIVRDAFQEAGYFKVDVSDVHCRVVTQTAGEHSVAVRAKVNSGLRYRLDKISFTQPARFPESDLRREVPLADGAVFSVKSVRVGLKNLRELYCHQGYINFTPIPSTEVDEAHHTISLRFDFDEGDRFTVGRLIVDGTPSVPGAKERLLAAWKKYEDQPFDCTGTFKHFLGDIHASPNIDPSRLFKSEVDPKTHVVNVVIVLGNPDSLQAAQSGNK